MIALVVEVDPVDVEIAADALWSLGVVAVEERAGHDGRIELWTSLGDDVEAIAVALAALPVSWPHRFVEVDDRVVDTWREFATPTWIADDLVVCPAWVDATFAPHVEVIEIEPGATFGMGDHPTTVLSLQAVSAVIGAGGVQSVLDVGCGSGVLAIAALRLGATSAVAVDISPAAAVATVDNARRNGVVGRIDASTTPLSSVTGSYDLVLANILAPALVELAPHLRRVLAPGGTLVVSGILADDHDHVLRALTPLQVRSTRVLDGWAAISLQP
ncbi:MAG: 50S ribosomal protein L11 methyltransferase [Acidimicrobiales bacterium]|nr:50S ribosomal protein L11 methyltransferase [Acidimicrobiales bacterium]MCB9393781.1 50S ribosomal protein L11 methyltransferase [Acidimicrobiaceae bacterium]